MLKRIYGSLLKQHTLSTARHSPQIQCSLHVNGAWRHSRLLPVFFWKNVKFSAAATPRLIVVSQLLKNHDRGSLTRSAEKNESSAVRIVYPLQFAQRQLTLEKTNHKGSKPQIAAADENPWRSSQYYCFWSRLIKPYLTSTSGWIGLVSTGCTRDHPLFRERHSWAA